MSTADSSDDRLFESDEPFELFARWMVDAEASEPRDPNAMCLATVDAGGMPDARMVLLKGADPRGFVFYTNTQSAKGVQLDANRKAALLFHWKSLNRQVRVRGGVERVMDAEADAYFSIGAWASEQSRPLPGRFALEKRVAEFGLKFGLGRVPRPPYWTGYRVIAERIEFWRDRPFRLHDRLVFERTDEGWRTERLYP